MDKQSTIAFVLIGLILVVWLYINSPEQNAVPSKIQDSTQVINDTVANKTVIKENEGIEKQEQTVATLNDTLQKDEVFKNTNESEKIITIETDLALIELTNKGGRIKKYFLKKYKTWYHDEVEDTSNFYDTHVQLINYSKDGGDFNIVFVTKEGKLVNSKDLTFKDNLSSSKIKITGKDSVQINFVYKVKENKTVTKSFKFFANDYSSKVDIAFDNMDDIVSNYRYDVEWSHGLNFVERNSVDEARYSNAAAYSGDEKVVVDASSVGDVETKTLNGKVDWVGVRNKYFTTIIAPENPSDEGGADFKGEHVNTKYGEREYYTATLRVPFNNQKHQKDSFDLYIGPIDYELLKAKGNHYQAIFEFGSFLGLKFITRPISEYLLLPLFKFLHQFIPNYGFVIIVFTIILKIALYPLTRQSYKSMKKMQQLQPKIAELKEKYKGDQQKVQKETMTLYSTYGVNPAGGCLPMLLQMPILFALFTFFSIAIELRQEPFIWWITNLSAPDVIYTLPFRLPLFGINAITGLAPLLGITMFLQQKMSVKDPSQKAMVYMMPIMMPLMFMGMSSGLNLYYLMFNIFSVAQQYYINKQKGDELVPVKNPKKKGGFMQKMMEAAEQQQKTQKQQSNKKGKR
jgi:YidC/Oxa1 family membrane protein insertase